MTRGVWSIYAATAEVNFTQTALGHFSGNATFAPAAVSFDQVCSLYPLAIEAFLLENMIYADFWMPDYWTWLRAVAAPCPTADSQGGAAHKVSVTRVLRSYVTNARPLKKVGAPTSHAVRALSRPSDFAQHLPGCVTRGTLTMRLHDRGGRHCDTSAGPPGMKKFDDFRRRRRVQLTPSDPVVAILIGRAPHSHALNRHSRIQPTMKPQFCGIRISNSPRGLRL